MKLHYSKILLFVLPLNILVTSLSNAHNKNKPYTTTHHTQTTRSLCECDVQSSIYDKDEDIKSVKEIFDRQTSKRFEEYEERIKDKRQKRKEQRDKNIQKIIEEDKREKSLADKVEKGCLMCGCGLGGVAASVGLFGGLGTYGWKTASTTVALANAEKVGAAKGAEAGVAKVIELIKSKYCVSTLGVQQLETLFTVKNDTVVTNITQALYEQYKATCLPSPVSVRVSGVNLKSPICKLVPLSSQSTFDRSSAEAFIKRTVENIVLEAEPVAAAATQQATNEVIQSSIAVVDAKSAYLYSAIGYSVLAILIIILVMIIIYLVLRYRRKKKMNKKSQYTKLLNQ
ncbi:rifin PIR protein, putative [Plasmodium reichenowi]|uniref:Rifin PIR protein, putative n=1 Tax=Plasmodium reichenowi TaxID=5854 RepID=A0A2P9DSM4_PLARE|nr:rifin PIR protein, putative [Plasmodium reichenowi]